MPKRKRGHILPISYRITRLVLMCLTYGLINPSAIISAVNAKTDCPRVFAVGADKGEQPPRQRRRSAPATAFNLLGLVQGTTMTDNEIEQMIQDKGLTAPRVTPEDLEANIASEHFFTAAEAVSPAYENTALQAPKPLELLTICVLVLRNGFTVTGESACASPENFDPETGRKRAKQNAVQKIWPLMGYHLK